MVLADQGWTQQGSEPREQALPSLPAAGTGRSAFPAPLLPSRPNRGPSAAHKHPAEAGWLQASSCSSQSAR